MEASTSSDTGVIFENYLNVINRNREGRGMFNLMPAAGIFRGNIIILTGSNGIYKIDREEQLCA